MQHSHSHTVWSSVTLSICLKCSIVLFCQCGCSLLLRYLVSLVKQSFKGLIRIILRIMDYVLSIESKVTPI